MRRFWFRLPPRTCVSAFANTRYWRGSEPAATETLANAKALGDWLAANAAMPRMREGGGGGAPSSMRCSTIAIALREAIYRIFLAIGEGAAAAGARSRSLQSALAETPQRLGVSARGGTYSWVVARAARVSLGGVLAPVIWSAADLLTHAGDRRIRRCANDKCRWVFVDRSKGGTRRWCDMSSCGNRAKAHRHYARIKKEPLTRLEQM